MLHYKKEIQTMKKSLLALPLIFLCLIFLCTCDGKRGNVNVEQIPTATKVTIANIVPPIFEYWDYEEFAVESECTEEELLADTVNLYPVEKSLKNVSSQTGNVFLEFSDDLYSHSLADSSKTYHMQTHKARLNDDTDLSVRLYAGYSTYGFNETGKVKFYVKGDTIYTLNFAMESGGFTPEGLAFKITGDGVASVTASYRMLYNATVFNPRKYRHIAVNRVRVCNLTTEELPLAVEDGYYTLPVVKTLELTASDWQKMEGLRPEAVKRWEDWTGEKMDTTYMEHIFDLDHFLIDLSVTYKDGSVRNYRHVAQGIDVEP